MNLPAVVDASSGTDTSPPPSDKPPWNACGSALLLPVAADRLLLGFPPGVSLALFLLLLSLCMPVANDWSVSSASSRLLGIPILLLALLPMVEAVNSMTVTVGLGGFGLFAVIVGGGRGSLWAMDRACPEAALQRARAISTGSIVCHPASRGSAAGCGWFQSPASARLHCPAAVGQPDHPTLDRGGRHSPAGPVRSDRSLAGGFLGRNRGILLAVSAIAPLAGPIVGNRPIVLKKSSVDGCGCRQVSSLREA